MFRVKCIGASLTPVSTIFALIAKMVLTKFVTNAKMVKIKNERWRSHGKIPL